MSHNFDEPFDGLPSVQLDHRPFFSIVVPCYNPRQWLQELLNSILIQNLFKDVQIILSDDHSTEDYQDIVEKYNKILSIKQIKTDYNFAPGNTREKGTTIAEGQWLTFIDQDDMFAQNALPYVKAKIEESNEKYYVIGDFVEIDPYSGEVSNEFKRPKSWCHAKFYNMDNLWRKYDIHFKKDLKTHEDIYIVANTIYLMSMINGNRPLYLDQVCYIWRAWPTSISRTEYDDTDFLEKFYSDYLESTTDHYIYRYEVDGERFKDEAINFANWCNRKQICCSLALDSFLYAFFYLTSFKFHKPDTWIKKNEQILTDYLNRIKKTFEMTNKDILDKYTEDFAFWYNNVRESSFINVGGFMQTEALPVFLNRVSPDGEA